MSRQTGADRLIRRGGLPALVALMLVVVALVVLGCSSSSTTTSAATETTAGSTATSAAGGTQVTMQNIAFAPQTITVKVGDTVTWTNQDSVDHNVTAADGSFKSANLGSGGTFSHTFTKAGTYAYSCTIHPGMTGTVIVQ